MSSNAKTDRVASAACVDCGAEIPQEHAVVAECPACGTTRFVTDVGVRVERLGGRTGLGGYRSPPRGLRLRCDWRLPTTPVLVAAALLWNAILMVGVANLVASFDPAQMLIAFHLVAGGLLLHAAITQAVNTTSLELCGGTLSTRHGPVPSWLFRGTAFGRSEIDDVRAHSFAPVHFQLRRLAAALAVFDAGCSRGLVAGLWERLAFSSNPDGLELRSDTTGRAWTVQVARNGRWHDLHRGRDRAQVEYVAHVLRRELACAAPAHREAPAVEEPVRLAPSDVLGGAEPSVETR